MTAVFNCAATASIVIASKTQSISTAISLKQSGSIHMDEIVAAITDSGKIMNVIYQRDITQHLKSQRILMLIIRLFVG